MLRPYFGVKGTWQKQKLEVVFEGNLVEDPVDFVITSMSNKFQTWGVGILGGINAAWHWTRSFSFIGNLAFTGMWQHFKIDRFDLEQAPFLGASLNFLNISSSFFKLSPIIEWMLGIRWESWFLCDTYHYSLEAGWEMQDWFSQNKFIRVPGSPKSDGDLAFQGLTVKARLDF